MRTIDKTGLFISNYGMSSCKQSLITEELELVRAGEQPEEVLGGEPDHAEGLHQVYEAVLHQGPVIQRLLGTAL